MKILLHTFAGLAASLCLLTAGSSVTPLTRAHAHNDYEHPHPLFDALAQGFNSVEADIHLVHGQLLVAHDLSQVKPNRTLQSLYLNPLHERVLANGGHVYPNGPNFYLLIDFKSAAGPTWVVLHRVLLQYADMLTVFRNNGLKRGAVTAILSGNSPRKQLAAEPVRLAGIDGRLPDLATDPSPYLVPWISDNWSHVFKWRGQGTMPADQERKLRQLVAKAHAQGRLIRFWGEPDEPSVWRVEFDAGVDFINTDRLAPLRQFLLHATAGANR